MKHATSANISRAALLVLITSSGFALPQSLPQVSVAEAKEHLLKYVDPVYPAIAKAAHVQGTVVLQVEIGKDGHVTKVESLDGPALLFGAATDAAKEWQYKPFERNGSPISVTVKLNVPFTLGESSNSNDEEIAKVYFPLSRKCVQLVTQRADSAEEASACQKAAEEADLFSKNSRFIERRQAYVYLATALIRDNRAQDAVAAGEKAIAVVAAGHDDDSGSSAAYGVAGQAKALSGDLAGADNDLETAESYQRKALDAPAGHELNESYSKTLKSLLSFHARVLSALGKEDQSRVKLEEANKL